jgi:hypothetical protein
MELVCNMPAKLCGALEAGVTHVQAAPVTPISRFDEYCCWSASDACRFGTHLVGATPPRPPFSQH